MLKDLVKRNRSYRRFYEDYKIDRDTLKELVDLARLTPSAANLQTIRYILSCEPEKNSLIFSALSWAGYLKDWPGPPEGERPSAYIVILEKKEETMPFSACDRGIVAQTILLGATEKGLGGCIFGSVKRDSLRASLNISPEYEIPLVIALGKPKEEVMIEKVGPDGNIKYWRDDKNIHYVPKRSLDELIVG